ncbi:hypothetical protein PTSG_12037 [Salpingoeca rosetta]|uniref:Glycosyltransferase 61 catalytic domain-containing protein n=1 Tax=Salpingoeca rosetta (strain ATCC 50818 / BSB-021) TaxID=946362 RepID=F2U5W5_SALR5|nr:uncharacterized protein PTSG_12037 [Salpingoeca rosetta]EGD82906.1 hypothetical protein PTSG_12037 [Salpingoeca rosetta]|eukprot:XP_004995270.1 hypothetical protein PTSG_12037 [Salpingoeca rosetta]
MRRVIGAGVLPVMALTCVVVVVVAGGVRGEGGQGDGNGITGDMDKGKAPQLNLEVAKKWIKWPVPAKQRSLEQMQATLDTFHKERLTDMFNEDTIGEIEAMQPSDLMTAINQHLASDEQLRAYAELYVLFTKFNSPELLSNAAVLLEQLHHHDAALLWYEIGRKMFPANEASFLENMKNTIQHYGRNLFYTGQFDRAKRAFKQLFKLVPDFKTARYNFAILLENTGDVPEAVNQLKKLQSTAKTKEEKLLASSTLCRVALSMCQTKGAALQAESFSTRKTYFGIAKDACAEAFQLAPEDPTHSYHDPDNVEYEHQLAGTLARCQASIVAVPFSRSRRPVRGFACRRPCCLLHALGIMISPMAPNHKIAKELMVDAVVRAPQTKPAPSLVNMGPCSSGSDAWTVALGAGASAVAAKSDVIFPPTGTVETRVHGNAPFDLQFPDKTTYHVVFAPAVVEGTGAVITSACEVIAMLDANTNLPAEFSPTRRPVEHVPGHTLYLLHSKMSNYYHLVAEVLTRLAVAADTGVTGSVDRVLTLSQEQAPLLHDFAALLAQFTSYDMSAFSDEDRTLEYDVAKKYEFSNLHVVSWSHPDGVLADDIDMWDSFLPSKSAAHLLNRVSRDIVSRVRASGQSPVGAALHRDAHRPKVVYCSRTGIRSVANEGLLIDEMKEHASLFDFHVFSSPPDPLLMPGSSVRNRLLYQMDLFNDADIIIGPHGAGLANAMFMKRGSTLVEFIMDPHGNRCFGYLAAALDHTYYAVNEVTSTYFGSYTMTEEAAHTITQRVVSIVKEQQQHHDEL